MYGRDRDRDRSRDRGDAYRPRRSPPRDNYNSSSRGGIFAADTYTPSSSTRGARRSRSPPPSASRGRGDGGRSRRSSRTRSRSAGPSYHRRSPLPARESAWRRSSPARDGRRSSPERRDDRRGSPPRKSRAYSPARDDDRGRNRDDDRHTTRYRSPARDDRDGYTRSSPRRDRNRSPAYSKRSREYSRDRSRARSPPPKRERIASPPRRYDSPPRRPRSPPAGPRADRHYDRRDRSRSPRRDERRESDRRHDHDEPLAAISAATSRRSSPPIHPSRLRQVPDDQSVRTDRSPRDSRAASPSMRQHSTRDSEREYDRDRDRDRDYNDRNSEKELHHRNGDSSRAPPSGPAASRSASGRFSPPSGPASGLRGASNPILSAPSRPRGGASARGTFNDNYRGGYRGDYGAPSPRRGDFGGGVSNRGGGYFGSGPPRGGSSFAPGFRGSSNSSSATYPRSQRFDGSSTVSKYLGDLPQIIPGGQRAPPRDPAAEQRLRRLEEEAEKLRMQIAEKSKIKRAGLREWDRLAAETENSRLRGDLAEENLRKMNGEHEDNGPAF